MWDRVNIVGYGYVQFTIFKCLYCTQLNQLNAVIDYIYLYILIYKYIYMCVCVCASTCASECKCVI